MINIYSCICQLISVNTKQRNLFIHIFDPLNYLFGFFRIFKTMEEKKIRRNLYRVLRKTGVQKRNISPDSSFTGDLQFDATDWSLFAYYLEGMFNISIKDDELVKLKNVENTIQYLGKSA